MEKFLDFDYEEEERARRPKRTNYDKAKCQSCGEPLRKKEKKHGLCWQCFDEEKGR